MNDGIPPSEVFALAAEQVEADLSEAVQIMCGEKTRPTDTQILNYLERHGTVNFDYEDCTIRFEIPEEFEGSNSIRDIVIAAMNAEDFE